MLASWTQTKGQYQVGKRAGLVLGFPWLDFLACLLTREKSDAFVYSELATASSCSQLSYIREQYFNWRWFHMTTPNAFLNSAPNLPRNWWEA